MAKISGQARDRFIRDGLISEDAAWTDEKDFGEVSNTTGTWVWNSAGKNSTIYKLLGYAKQRWADISGTQHNVVPDVQAAEPTYFKQAYFAGVGLNPIDAAAKYGGLIPVVALYEIDWDSYYAATG